MNIIIFTENNRAGGMDTFYTNLAKSWPKADDRFIFICNKGHPGLKFLIDEFPSNTRTVSHSILLNWDLNWVNKINILIIQRILRKLLRYLLIPYQYLAIKKLLKTYHADHLIAVNGGYPGGFTTRLANIAWKSLGKGKSIHSLHGLLLNRNSSIPNIFSLLEKYFTSKHLASLDHLICVSQACADSFKNYPDYDFKKIIDVVHNGINLEEEKEAKNIPDLRKTLQLNKDANILLMLATYDANKGHSHLFKAMNIILKRYPECHLVICGDHSGTDKSSVNKIMENIMSNIDNVHLLDYIPNASNLIKQADVLLIASQITESFGLTAVEAMRHKKPIVSTDTDALKEVIGLDGNAGYCLDKNNYILYAEKIIYLLDNPDARKTMGENGNKRVKAKFNSIRMAKEYHSLLLK